jgi:phospholipid/cholesterol/gamma-HCH transport system substrate-binding protein
VRVRTADGAYRPLEVIADNRLHDPLIAGVLLNLRDVSERVVQGRGLLGTLLSDGRAGTGAEAEGGQTALDFAAAMANLRVITDRLRAGEGTLGGLLEDPSVYENLAAFLDGAQRSFLLRALMRSSIGGGADAASGGDGSRAGPRR